MKHLLAITIAMFALCSTIDAGAQQVSTSDLVRITGFSNGVYSVGNDTASQLTKNVIAPIKEALSRAPNGEVTINVQGCATENGGPVANSTAGQTRAANVEGFLEQQLRQYPNIKFKPWSNGSAANSWEVVVSWTVVAPVSPRAQASSNTNVHSLKPWIYAAIASLTIVAGFFIAFVLFSMRATTSKQAPAPLAMAEAPAPPTVIEMPLREQSPSNPCVEAQRPNGRTCRVHIVPQGPVWMTPFKTQKEPRQPIFRKDYRQAVYATKQCIANPLYQSEIDLMIAEGKIEEVAS